ncbi:hypothetical protein [Nannocystis exedens]|nr:hypothetical protein [Nannocystis exedens]
MRRRAPPSLHELKVPLADLAQAEALADGAAAAGPRGQRASGRRARRILATTRREFDRLAEQILTAHRRRVDEAERGLARAESKGAQAADDRTNEAVAATRELARAREALERARGEIEATRDALRARADHIEVRLREGAERSGPARAALPRTPNRIAALLFPPALLLVYAALFACLPLSKGWEMIVATVLLFGAPGLIVVLVRANCLLAASPTTISMVLAMIAPFTALLVDRGAAWLVRGLARQVEVAEAPAHRFAGLVTFASGTLRPDLAGQSVRKQAFRGGGLARYVHHVVPLVPAGWTPSQPVPAWVAGPDETVVTTVLERGEIGRGAHRHGELARRLDAGEIVVRTPLPERVRDAVVLHRSDAAHLEELGSIERAIAATERRHGLHSHPDAPIVVPVASAEAERSKELLWLGGVLFVFFSVSLWAHLALDDGRRKRPTDASRAGTACVP